MSAVRDLRARPATFVVLAVVQGASAVLWDLAGNAPFAFIMSVAFGFSAVTAVTKWRNNRHGSDRKAEAGPQDPPSIPGYAPTITVNFASGGPVPAARSSADAASPDLEVVESDVPILAQRAARLVFDGTSRHWAALNHREESFGVDADARCRLTEWMGYRYSTASHHEGCPHVSCSCGFYAVPCDMEPWTEGGSYVTLLVELSGTVIEHEKGYRAQHQRVMECRIPPCRFCGATAEVLDVRDNAFVSACCESHVPKVDGQVLVTISDLADLLPVPVIAATRELLS